MKIIKVDSCYECPEANRANSYCGYFGENGSPGGGNSNLIYRNIKDKTLPEWCPLEDVQGIIRNVSKKGK